MIPATSDITVTVLYERSVHPQQTSSVSAHLISFTSRKCFSAVQLSHIGNSCNLCFIPWQVEATDQVTKEPAVITPG